MDSHYVFLKACYLKYAKRTNEATNFHTHDKWYTMAKTVLSMITDHYGTTAAGSVICAADMELPDDGRLACAGIYINHKFANKE
jgi:hypothetical protein